MIDYVQFHFSLMWQDFQQLQRHPFPAGFLQEELLWACQAHMLCLFYTRVITISVFWKTYSCSVSLKQWIALEEVSSREQRAQHPFPFISCNNFFIARRFKHTAPTAPSLEKNIKVTRVPVCINTGQGCLLTDKRPPPPPLLPRPSLTDKQSVES